MTADLEKINGYSIALTEKVCNDIFAGKDKVTGDEIKNLLPVQQINTFIIKGLFSRWKAEMARLRSPYFNYDSDEVREAMNNLMNKLSNNIAVTREFFRPLLITAIEDTLILATNPAQVIEREWKPGEQLTPASIQEREKFYKINRQYFSYLKEYLASSGKPSISSEEAVKLLKESKLTPDDSGDLFEKLSALLEIEVNSIKLSPSLEKAEVFPVAAPEIQHTPPTPPSFDGTPPLSRKSSPSAVRADQSDEVVPLYQKFAGNKEPEEAKPFRSPVKDLKSEISLSQKFLFINSLFQGNSEEYTFALEKVEQCKDLETAKNFLHQNYAVKYNWNYEEQELRELMDLIERRFY